MLEMILNGIAALGVSEAESLLTSAGESTIKKYKSSSDWKKLLVDTGEFFINNEREANSFFDELSLALSKENMTQLAKDLQAEDGYQIKHRLFKLLMRLMAKYEIPYEIAESYCMRIMYEVLEQLKTIEPDKYEHYFLQEWREEQENSFRELREKMDKMSSDLAIYQKEQVSIISSGQMDISLRKSTFAPSIGIEFFVIDDEQFQEEFEERRHEELLYVRGRCREESIYCILNELWRLNERRPVYVVKSLESWQKLQAISSENNIYIPWFYADEIVAIENNTNIFVLDENTPAYTRDVINLRPRTHDTLSRCLCEAGMETDKAYALISDTHGLYIPMKKHLFRGEFLKQPAWIDGISDKVKKICLLLGKWEEIDGDKLIIESLYEDNYEKFLEEVLPYTTGEDPFLYVVKRNNSVVYSLASTENTWECLNVSLDEPLWKKFVGVFLEVLNESEKLFVYNGQERLLAQLKGEKLFWSETIRKGMVKTLIMKGFYRKDEDAQPALDSLVSQILAYIKNEEQWVYISRFWTDLCEISPQAVLNRLDKEFSESTGLFRLFEKQTSDFVFGRNAYIEILWGVEQFLVQKEYFWSGFRWLLKLDSREYEYKSNSPKDTFAKVFCTWHNFSAIRLPEEKIAAAEIALELSNNNAWTYLYEAIPHHSGSMVGELSAPKYRDHIVSGTTTIGDMREASMGYFEILLLHMDFSVERWKKMIEATEELSGDLRIKVFDQLLYEITQMSDYEVITIKNSIRNLIYKHRYFSSSSWSMSEEKLAGYEKLLDDIHTKLPEYEYGYLFSNNGNYPLLHPVPYDEKGEREDNEIATEKLIQEKLIEFQDNGYQIGILTELCAKESYSSLGEHLAKYWNRGKWDFEVFKELLSKQESGTIAVDYMASAIRDDVCLYPDIISDVSNLGYSDDILAKIYRVEAHWTSDIPLVDNASENIKTIFWGMNVTFRECNEYWALNESKKYSKLDDFLEQMYRFHYRKPLSAQEIYFYFDGIEQMPHSQGNQMTSYYIELLLEIIQKEYLYDVEKCMRISQIEIFFMNLLEWDNMKCFHHMIKRSPELLSQLVAGVFKRDHASKDKNPLDGQYVHNMYSIYHKAHFCPAEENGMVSEEKLEQWIEQFKVLLEQNDQSSLFGTILGRLFSFSPVGKDGYEPCEAVRKMIEKYSDDHMRRGYETAVYNRRGVFSPTAGKEELKMAEGFKANAEYLAPLYPETAKIFYDLYDTYRREAERERKDAENGMF